MGNGSFMPLNGEFLQQAREYTPLERACMLVAGAVGLFLDQRE